MVRVGNCTRGRSWFIPCPIRLDKRTKNVPTCRESDVARHGGEPSRRRERISDCPWRRCPTPQIDACRKAKRQAASSSELVLRAPQAVDTAVASL